MFKKTPLKRVLYPRALTQVMAGVFAVVSILSGTLLFHSSQALAANATNNTVNFQARLQTAAGSIVPDGYYNVQFKLYDGDTAGGPAGIGTGYAGTNLWTETWYDSNGTTAGNDNRVRVQNGYLTVSLGSQTAFPNTINWDQNLWITMNIGGTTQTATPTWDGEMNPRLKLTAVPYAFRAGQLAQFNSGTGFTATLGMLQPTGGNQTFQVADQGAAGTYSICVQGSTTANGGCAPTTGGSGYIQNQNAAQQTANFWLSGTGRADTALQAPLLDTSTAALLGLGNTNATAINIGRSSGTTNITTTIYGTTVLQNNGDSATAFQVLTHGGLTVLGVDTSGFKVIINDTVQTGNTSVASTPSNNLTLMSGNATGTTSNSGDVRIDTGTATGTTGIIKIGDTNASGIILGRSGLGVAIPSSSSLTIGTSSANDGGIIFKNATNANTLTLQSGATSSNLTLTMPVADGVNGNCLQTDGSGHLAFGSCTNAPGSSAADVSLDNLSAVALNTSLLPGTAGAIDLGSSTKSFGNLYLAGTSTTPASNYFEITGVATGARTITLPDATGTVCLSSGNCSAGTSTLQGAYGNSAGGSTPEIKVDATRGGVDIQDADTTISANLFNVRSSNSGGLGSSIFNVYSGGSVGINMGLNTTPSADLTFGEGTNRTINVLNRTSNAAGNSLTIQGGSAGAGANAMAGGSLLLQGGNAAGTTGNTNGGDVQIFGGTPVNSGVAGNVILAYDGSGARGRVGIGKNNPGYMVDVAGDVNISSGSSFRINGTPICTSSGCSVSSGSSSYIQNNTSQQLGANFNIDGTGIAATLQAANFDTAAAGTMGIGMTNATTINIGTNNIGHTIAIGTGTAIQGITIGSTNSTSATTIQGGTGNINLVTNSASAGTIVKTSTNSQTAFVVQNASNLGLLSVDTANTKVVVGNGANTITLNPTFDTANGMYGGTARPLKKIVLSPEYPSAILDAANDGVCATANSGSMTSGFTGVATPSAIQNYYKWTTSNAASQCYDVVVRIPVPNDFSAWSSAPTISGLSSDGTAGLNVEIRDTTGTVDSSNYTALPLGTNTWTTTTLGGLTGTYTAGGTMTVRIRMSAINNDYAMAGQITLPYYAKF